MLYNFVIQFWLVLTFIKKVIKLTLLTSWRVVKVTNLILLILVNLLEIQIKKLFRK